MGYILFLVAVLISTFYYFRTLKRFESFDSEISETLQREMGSLIVDFSRTASQNISLLEDKVSEGKEFLKELIVRIDYLRQVRDNLDCEIRKLQKSVFLMKSEYTMFEGEEKGIVQRTYDLMEDEYLDQKIIESVEKEDKEEMLMEDKLDIDPYVFSCLEYSQIQDNKKICQSRENMGKKVIGRSKISQKKSKESNSSLSVPITPVKDKNQVLKYYHQGWSVQKISSILGISKGEVEIIIQLFYG